MQILARIPVLQADAESKVWSAGMPTLSGTRAAGIPTDRPVLQVSTPGAVAESASAAAPAEEAEEAPRTKPVAEVISADAPAEPARRARSTRLPAPSILVLSILAVAMWVAALRNDRVRLEAARQARAERLAQAMPDAVGPGGSRTR
jgi:hypothetical protein